MSPPSSTMLRRLFALTFAFLIFNLIIFARPHTNYFSSLSRTNLTNANFLEKESEEAITELFNIARGKPSFLNDMPLEKGYPTDGIVRGLKTDECVSLKEGDIFEIDFLVPFNVEEINLYFSKPDNHSAQISLLDSKKQEQYGENLNTTLRNMNLWFIESGSQARYLRIRFHNSLKLCEVEVYAPISGKQRDKVLGREIHLLITYFKDEAQPDRALEIKHATLRNIRNPHFTFVHVLTEQCDKFSFSLPKIQLICMERQPYYSDFFNYSTTLKSGIFVISNSDVIFTDSVQHAPDYLTLSNFFVISRWSLSQCFVPNTDDREVNYCFEKPYSFDSFLLSSQISLPFFTELNFPMNRQHAEHHAKYALKSFGLTPTNACDEIPIFHFHCTTIRSWRNGQNDSEVVLSNRYNKKIYPGRLKIKSSTSESYP